VVIWKGGRTEASERAISSHTGSLAVSQVIWDTAMKQCGAVGVGRQVELIDTLKALLYLPPIKGDRVAVAGGGGGQSVAIADVYGEAGLNLPTLTQESADEFATFFSLVGGGCRNPIDTGNPNREQMKRIMNILERDANIDNLVLLLDMQFGTNGLYTPEQIQDQIDLLIELKKRTTKPVMAVVSYTSAREMEGAEKVSAKFQAGGVPAFPSIERGSLALKNAFDYYRMKKSLAGSGLNKV
jgi:acyl-CoA synthetase (NDP forming)